MIALWIVGGVVAATTAVFLLAGRSGLTRGRFGRTVRIGRLGARLSASWLGAKLRRLFAGKARRARIDEARRKADAERVARTMGEMKGALMKLGQMLSFVSDDIPAEYRAALQSLQAAAPPMDFALIRDVAERELERPLERAFARFDETPLASASIGQVHRATLPTGEEVVVKIQYPGVAEAIRGDLANVGLLYRFMGMAYPNLEPGPLVEEIKHRLTEELDYRNEAKNQSTFHELYDGHPFIRVPRVIASCSTARVLTSEYCPGRSFDEVCKEPEAERSRWGEVIYRFVFGSINRHGVFNADPHPGNYLFDSQGRVVFLDYGCVKYFPPGMLAHWRALVLAHIRGDRDAFRRHIRALDFITDGCPVSTDMLYDYWAYFYEPIERDREFTFTRAYNAKSLKLVFAPDGRFAGISKHLNMPRDFVFVNRIQWGVYSVLSQLEATRNWHRVQREYWEDAPGQTELGRMDQEYLKRATRTARRSAAAAPLDPAAEA